MESTMYLSSKGTFNGRYQAARFDTIAALLLSFLAAKSLPTENPYWQTLVVIAVYLGYFFLFETFFSRTAFKMLLGLIVLKYDGDRLSAREAAIRTIFRVIDANPALIGGDKREPGSTGEWIAFGSLPGTTAMAHQRRDGYNVAVLMNGRRNNSFVKDNELLKKSLEEALKGVAGK